MKWYFLSLSLLTASCLAQPFPVERNAAKCIYEALQETDDRDHKINRPLEFNEENQFFYVSGTNLNRDEFLDLSYIASPVYPVLDYRAKSTFWEDFYPLGSLDVVYQLIPNEGIKYADPNNLEFKKKHQQNLKLIANYLCVDE